MKKIWNRGQPLPPYQLMGVKATVEGDSRTVRRIVHGEWPALPKGMMR